MPLVYPARDSGAPLAFLQQSPEIGKTSRQIDRKTGLDGRPVDNSARQLLQKTEFISVSLNQKQP